MSWHRRAGSSWRSAWRDRWDPAVNDPGDALGGKFVSLGGDDRASRYYVAHLDSVAVAVGQRVTPGAPLGVMGQTGNARNSACHTHVGFSWMCPSAEWKVRRGKVWPQDFLRAWRDGRQDSPADAVALSQLADPDACAEAAALMPPSPDPRIRRSCHRMNEGCVHVVT